MNLQLSRIESYCQELNLVSIPTNWSDIANQILVKEGSYADFLEQVLFDELEAKKTRTKNTLLKMASLPSIKTLDHYDFNFASGTPKALVHELAGLGFISIFRVKTTDFSRSALASSCSFLNHSIYSYKSC